jgi:protein gp37
MNKTNIQYLTHTFNPVAMRCTKISEACGNCWHLKMADRLAANPTIGAWERDAYAGGGAEMRDHRLLEPYCLKKPAVIGVQFMGDLFHEDISFAWVDEILGNMAQADWHTFVLLTKRAKRMSEYMTSVTRTLPSSNMIGMVTVENQARADERIPDLLVCPFVIRGVSVEPMLGPVDLDRYLGMMWLWEKDQIAYAEKAHQFSNCEIPKLKWVICGCESGPKRRPTNIDWVRSLRDQCVDAGVPFFLKQLEINGKVVSMPELDGQVWDQMPSR